MPKEKLNRSQVAHFLVDLGRLRPPHRMHSTFSKNRHGRVRDSDLLQRLFETVLQRCIDEGLVGGEGFAVDASLIQADASDRNRVEGAAGLPPGAAGRAVEEYLAVLDDAAFGAASEVTPKFIAPADPATRWTAAHRGPAFFAYSANYLIDVDWSGRLGSGHSHGSSAHANPRLTPARRAAPS